jgi:hypothetical protein
MRYSFPDQPELIVVWAQAHVQSVESHVIPAKLVPAKAGSGNPVRSGDVDPCLRGGDEDLASLTMGGHKPMPTVVIRRWAVGSKEGRAMGPKSP